MRELWLNVWYCVPFDHVVVDESGHDGERHDLTALRENIRKLLVLNETPQMIKAVTKWVVVASWALWGVECTFSPMTFCPLTSSM